MTKSKLQNKENAILNCKLGGGNSGQEVPEVAADQAGVEAEVVSERVRLADAKRGVQDSADGAMIELVTAYHALSQVRDQMAAEIYHPLQTDEAINRASNIDHLSDVLCDLIVLAGTMRATTLGDLRAKSGLLLNQLSDGYHERIEQLTISICLDIQSLSKTGVVTTVAAEKPCTEAWIDPSAELET